MSWHTPQFCLHVRIIFNITTIVITIIIILLSLLLLLLYYYYCLQETAVLAREALAREGKLESTLQACAADAARKGNPFFVLPQGVHSNWTW